MVNSTSYVRLLNGNLLSNIILWVLLVQWINYLVPLTPLLLIHDSEVGSVVILTLDRPKNIYIRAQAFHLVLFLTNDFIFILIIVNDHDLVKPLPTVIQLLGVALHQSWVPFSFFINEGFIRRSPVTFYPSEQPCLTPRCPQA